MIMFRFLVAAALAATSLANPFPSETDIENREVTSCAVVLCPADTECQMKNGRPVCTKIRTPCGPKTCKRDEVCCNEVRVD
jgi:hypothetical protein